MPRISAALGKFLSETALSAAEKLGIRTQIGATGTDDITNALVNTAIGTDPAASRTALGLGTAALSAVGDFDAAGAAAAAQAAAEATAAADATTKANDAYNQAVADAVSYTDQEVLNTLRGDIAQTHAAAVKEQMHVNLGLTAYDDLAAANAALGAGLPYYDRALGRLNNTTA